MSVPIRQDCQIMSFSAAAAHYGYIYVGMSVGSGTFTFCVLRKNLAAP